MNESNFRRCMHRFANATHLIILVTVAPFGLLICSSLLIIDKVNRYYSWVVEKKASWMNHLILSSHRHCRFWISKCLLLRYLSACSWYLLFFTSAKKWIQIWWTWATWFIRRNGIDIHPASDVFWCSWWCGRSNHSIWVHMALCSARWEISLVWVSITLKQFHRSLYQYWAELIFRCWNGFIHPLWYYVAWIDLPGCWQLRSNFPHCGSALI